MRLSPCRFKDWDAFGWKLMGSGTMIPDMHIRTATGVLVHFRRLDM